MPYEGDVQILTIMVVWIVLSIATAPVLGRRVAEAAGLAGQLIHPAAAAAARPPRLLSHVPAQRGTSVVELDTVRDL